MPKPSFPHILWDHVNRANLPLSDKFRERKLFITKGAYIQDQYVYSILGIAERCPQHSFLLNMQTEQGWDVMPPNVFPVFNFSSSNPEPFQRWLEEDYGLLKPRIVQMFANSQKIVENLNCVDWVMIHGLIYRHVNFAVKDTIRQNHNVYVSSLRNKRHWDDLPQPLRYRRVPVRIKRELYDNLLGTI